MGDKERDANTHTHARQQGGRALPSGPTGEVKAPTDPPVYSERRDYPAR